MNKSSVSTEVEAIQQYSLRRLIAGITIFSMVLSFAVGFPIVTGRITVKLLLVAPAAVVFGVACFVSKKRKGTAAAVLAGIFLGWLLTPRMYVYWGPEATFWDEFLVDFTTEGMGMFGGAILGAIADYIALMATAKSDAEK